MCIGDFCGCVPDDFFNVERKSVSSDPAGDPRISIITSPGLVPIHMPTVRMSFPLFVHPDGGLSAVIDAVPFGQNACITCTSRASAALFAGRVYISM